MEIAVIADLHGNYEAFKACVSYLANRSIEAILFLGDYVGEFGFPQQTMALLKQLDESYTCHWIKGNKEDYWLKQQASSEALWKEYDSTTGSLYYTYHQLTPDDLAFFASLPITRDVHFPGYPPITLCHGSPLKVNQPLLINDEDTQRILASCPGDLIVCGHTHIQQVITGNNRRAINPGSIGVPLYSQQKTQFMILHGEEGQWREEFISLNYAMELEIERLSQSGLSLYAPYWTKTTIQILRHGNDSHARVLSLAMAYCEQERGECIWPFIPEIYWERAYRELYEKK